MDVSILMRSTQADIEFVRELSTRNDYLMATLNPDNPDLPVYKEFINKSRPYKKYAGDVPEEIMRDLSEPVNPKWRYWFFTFNDNLSLTPEAIQKKKDAAPVGTKLTKIKYLVYVTEQQELSSLTLMGKRHVLSKSFVKSTVTFQRFTAGLDTAYSIKQSGYNCNDFPRDIR